MSEKQRTREYLKQVIKLSIPAVLAQISSIIMQYIDASMVGSRRRRRRSDWFPARPGCLAGCASLRLPDFRCRWRS